MQTFLLFLIKLEKNKNVYEALKECFNETAKSLDYKRLGKQRVEALQLLNILLNRMKIDNEFKTLEEARELIEKYDSTNWPYKQSYTYTKKRLEKNGWKNHPALTMWKGYSEELKLYFNIIVEEWIKRKYKNNLSFENVDKTNLRIPPFLTNEDFIKIQRQNLIRKNSEYYGKIWSDLEPTDGYLWFKEGTFYRKKYPKE